MRDDFTKTTIINIARRVSFLCSNPECKRHTIGPQAGGEGSINVGEAAHITAASAGGPRYEASLSTEERRNASNAIWLCQICSKLIDSDVKHFSVELLRNWKKTAEERAFAAIASAPGNLNLIAITSIELDDADQALIRGLGLSSADDIESVTSLMLAAAKADIQAFKRVHGWPRHSISLNLRTQDSSGVHAVSVTGVAAAITISNEISFVAAPGTGKTTTLVQVADEILSSGSTIATFVPLAEWSSRPDSIFQSLTRRNAFHGFREQHFMLLAYHGRLVLLLDGWNELDPASRTRAIHELNALRRDYPLLAIVVSTRRQVRNVPVSGPTIDIEALSEEQQLEIARAIRGRDGEELLDQAWRMPGVRELISIPLYLNALLGFATSGKMPTTKEEVLRLFVIEHENSPARADVLERELLGFHKELLTALAVEATKSTNTTITDSRARTVISQAEDQLVATGQIKNQPQPSAVLDVLVSQHMLIRSSRDSGVSFQHQQFQEWYASYEVERQMLAAADDGETCRKFNAEILDMPAWEESILFACDRLSRTGQAGERTVAATVLRTLSIDPMLTAEMIYRASSGVWDFIKDDVIAFVGRWHKPGKVDRATRFMITTGRPEFAAQIWPLVTNPDMQVHLSALRISRSFRPSVLGSDVQARISGIPEQVREHLIAEIASESGIDGIELATALAKADPSTAVKVAVIESLHFRCADRFVADILNTASEDVWSVLARRGYADEISDPDVAARLRRELQCEIERETNTLTKIGMLINEDAENSEVARKVASIIETGDFPAIDQHARWILHRAFGKFPLETGEAVLNRIQAGRELPFPCEDFLESLTDVDEGIIPALVIDCSHENRLADTVAVVVGPKTVHILVDRFLAYDQKMQGMQPPIDEATREQYYCLKHRISSSNVRAFLPAILSFSDTEDPHRISVLSDLVARHGKSVEADPLKAEPGLLESTVSAIQRWVKVMLTSPQANRHQLAEVARAIKRLPRPEFVEGLSHLLAEDLSRWQHARQESFARPGRGPIPPDVSHTYTNLYQQAFAAIGDDQVLRLMERYLPDPQFGIDAACVLMHIWKSKQNGPEQKSSSSWSSGPPFSEVRVRRKQRIENESCDISPYAEAIFAVVEQMARPDGPEKDQRHAMQLSKIAFRMPYGEKYTVIKALLSLPLPPIQERRELWSSLIFAGEMISADMVLDGLREFLEEAKQKSWLLDDQYGGIETFLELLPFSDRPVAVLEALELVDKRYQEPRRMQGLLSALGNAPDELAEILLLELANRDPRLFKKREWLEALMGRGTPSSVIMVLDLICGDKLIGEKREIDGWWLARKLAAMIRNHPELKPELLSRYEGQTAGADKLILEEAIAELADHEGLLALVRGYARDGRHFDGLLHRMIEKIALGKQPVSDLTGAYEHYSVNISDLRKNLFEMLNDNPAEANIAEACLTAIDELRDEHGRVNSEPRHPDIASGRPWPFVPPKGM